MNPADTRKNITRSARSRTNWRAPSRAWQVVLSIWTAAWLALAPIPAYASQPVNPQLAIQVAVPDGEWNQSGRPTPGEIDQDEPQPDTSPATYLPDLRTLPMHDLHIRLLPNGGRALRLANTIWNSGQGPLELTGEVNAVTNRTRVYQHIYGADGEQRKILVGEFVWHPTHDHWHFDEFTLYELWTLEPDLSLGEVAVSSDKLSYCVVDTDVVDRGLPYFPSRRSYLACDQRQQGLSVGWGDTYKSYLDGQALDLTGLPDGYYVLISSVNPNAVILEENYRNNSARVYIAIWRDRLVVLTLDQIRLAGCDESRCE